MPELPEVETIAQTLSPLVCGRTILGVELLNAKSLDGPLPLETLLHRRVKAVGRRGKLLLIHLEERSASPAKTEVTGLAVHLKMTGRLFVYAHDTKAAAHARAIFHLSDGNRLLFDDTRKFGYLRVMSPETLSTWDFWNRLGPEPLETDAAAFAARFRGRGAAMKALLLDQTVIAGVGNIYADESLFRAGIAPATRAREVSDARLEKLHAALQDVLHEAIRACGSSIRDYRTAQGDAGAFQNAFRVYGRMGKACVNCGRTLEGGRVAGRSTVWCTHCQY